MAIRRRQSSGTTAPPSDDAQTADDIPVLNEAIAVEDATPAVLPNSDKAREIVIRAIARLNIERRKAGEPLLDIKLIERLRRILTESLERHESPAP